MDTTADVERLVVVIKREFSRFPEQTEIDSIAITPPAKVIDCVLSINRKYDGFVVPRVKEFIARRSDIIDLEGLKKLIVSYPTPLDFLVQELNYNHKERADILCGVLEYLLTNQSHYVGKTENERLHDWAVKAQPRAYRDVNVKGFGLAGFQYLRILFGAQTTKPDVHIMNFITAAIGKKVDPEDAIELIESAAKKMNISARTIDAAIWLRMSSGSGGDNISNANKLSIIPAVLMDEKKEEHGGLTPTLMKQDASGGDSVNQLAEKVYPVPPVVGNGGKAPEQVSGKGTTGSVEGKSKIPTKTILEVLAGILAAPR